MDNRANIKIEFEIYGEKFSTDMSINYYVDECVHGGVDERIIEFFQKSYNIAKTKNDLKKLENKNGRD